MAREPMETTRQDRIYCLKASSDYHSEVCEECRFYPNCDHTKQDDMTELTIKDLEILEQTPYPLCIVEDRYSGAYSGASFLAFNMSPMGVAELPIDAGDTECLNFWNGYDKDYDLDDYVIGKGDTPEEALQNLVSLLDSKGVQR